MLTRFAQFAPKVFMLAVVSRLPDGGACLAGAGMGTMFCNVTGNSFVSGSGYGGSSLMAQAFGASNPERVGVLLLRQLAMHALLVAALITPVWLAAEPLLLGPLGQPEQTAHLAARFALVRLVALPAATIVQDLSAFLIAQGASRLPAATTVVASVAQAGLMLLLVRPQGAFAIGYDGAALAMSLTEIAQAAVLFFATPRALVSAGGAHVRTWPKLSLTSCRESVRGWGEMLSVGVPAAVMTMAEWLGWEAALFQAGRLCPVAASACAPLQVFPVLSQTMVVLFMGHFGFSIAAGARIANALGAGRPNDARCTAATALLLAASIGLAAATGIFLWRHEWAALFVDPQVSARHGPPTHAHAGSEACAPPMCEGRATPRPPPVSPAAPPMCDPRLRSH
jgi:MATE family multidrug resistance protein